MSKLMISRMVFSDQSIATAVEAYGGIARITYHLNGNYAEVIFEKCTYDEKLTIKEFENYLIGIENS